VRGVSARSLERFRGAEHSRIFFVITGANALESQASMTRDANERRAERVALAAETAKAVEQLAAQARATIADWETRVRVESGSSDSVAAAQRRHCHSLGPIDRLAQLEGELSALRREADEARRAIEEESRRAYVWEARALLAVEEGQDDLARQALERHQRHRAVIEALQAELRVIDAIIEDYRVNTPPPV
jgi:phage shock protein A